MPEGKEAMTKSAFAAPAALVLVMSLLPAVHIAAQQPTPTATAEEQRIYEDFRAWITVQPAEVHQLDDDAVFRRYAAFLQTKGKSPADATSAIEQLRKIGDRAEVERWNRILTSPTAAFNKAPNAFLAEMVKGMRPGRALDVGMGQGRNTIFLAQQGWDAVGFDPADRAVAAAQQQAAQLGVKITARVARAEDFDWGTAQWDLIVLSYVGGRELVSNVVQSLRPGGMVLIEGFHRDATKTQPIGGAVVFDTNELLTLYSALRVVRYEDTEGVADFGLQKVRVVRLSAQKPSVTK
jgi:2-polyprenyl-3-methyl-5-hydroxy-6-metoxy-1,4-benzoquinol methylase